MSNREFTEKRTGLASEFAAAGAHLLDYMCTGGALAAIPNTEPQQYVVAGTLPLIAKLLPAESPIPPLTAPAPLTDERITEISRAYRNANGTLLMDLSFARAIEREVAKAAPAPQQSELSSFFVAMLDTFAKRPDAVNKQALLNQIMWAIEDAAEDAAKAAPASPVQTAEPKRIPDMLTVETIQGAIAFGRMGINPPPSPDHWGNEFWQIGRQLAKLGETSAWDNVTPVDVAAPVQADQAQAGQAAAVRAAEWISVEDRLPQPETDVLIMRLGQIRIGAIFIEHESWEEGGREIHYWDDSNDDGQGWNWCEVTHWMPLPAAPSTATSNDTGALGDTGGAK